MFNRLSVKGSRKELEIFRRSVGGVGFSHRGIGEYNDLNFDSIIPIPNQQVLRAISNRNIFEVEGLRLKYWGTSSEAIGVRLIETNNRLEYTFCTFTKMPEALIRKIIAKFPHLKIRLDAENERLGEVFQLVSRSGKSFKWTKTSLF